jgi:hypothetical protein
MCGKVDKDKACPFFIKHGKANKNRAYLALLLSSCLSQWHGKVNKDKTCLASFWFSL